MQKVRERKKEKIAQETDLKKRNGLAKKRKRASERRIQETNGKKKAIG